METKVTPQEKPPFLSLKISQTSTTPKSMWYNKLFSVETVSVISTPCACRVFYVQYLLRALLGKVLHTFLLSIVREFLRLLSGDKQLGLLSSSFRNSVAKGGVADKFGTMDCKQRKRVRKNEKVMGHVSHANVQWKKQREFPLCITVVRKILKRSASWEVYKYWGRPTGLRERWIERGGEGREKGRNKGIPLLFPFLPCLFDA